MSKHISRRAFLKATGTMGAGTALGCLGLALHEPQELQVVRLEIHLARLPRVFDGLRVVQLSDIHFDEFMSRSHLQRIVDVANAQSPDLVLLTGDYVTGSLFGGDDAKSIQANSRRAEKAWQCAEVLRELRAPRHGRIAVLGNHDCVTNPEIVTEALTSAGIAVLRNRSIPIESLGARLWIAGVDDMLEHYGEPDTTMRGVPRDECVLTALHEPDDVEIMRKYGIDLQLSGHSHGGQIRFPGIGPLYLPRGGKKYPMGYYRVGSVQLYTNRGIGVIHLPLRFMCPPEITVITLRDVHVSGPPQPSSDHR